MGKMALGYGSEFHLLRWLGRHRSKFDDRVKQLLTIDNITWLDFEFARGKEIPDKELKGLSFLPDEPEYNSVKSKFKEEWPQSGNPINWDLVGYTLQNNEKTWILLEAKAHIGELKNNCNAESKSSYLKIEKALDTLRSDLNILIDEGKPWTKGYYQHANRIYILNLLKRQNINAKLINVYFIGDKIFKSRKSPKNKETWSNEAEKMKKHLNIDKLSGLGIYDMYLEIDN